MLWKNHKERWGACDKRMTRRATSARDENDPGDLRHWRRFISVIPSRVDVTRELIDPQLASAADAGWKRAEYRLAAYGRWLVDGFLFSQSQPFYEMLSTIKNVR